MRVRTPVLASLVAGHGYAYNGATSEDMMSLLTAAGWSPGKLIIDTADVIRGVTPNELIEWVDAHVPYAHNSVSVSIDLYDKFDEYTEIDLPESEAFYEYKVFSLGESE